jgi:hypothetical protein
MKRSFGVESSTEKEASRSHDPTTGIEVKVDSAKETRA